MAVVTPNMSIYIPANGEKLYGTSFAAGLINIDQHDHSGAPNKGVPITTVGIADFSVTRQKLNANVVLANGGLRVDATFPNALAVTGAVQNMYEANAGIMVKTTNGKNSAVVPRTITGTANQVAVTNGDGVAGNPTLGISDNAVLPGTEGFVPPSGTTAERPGTPVDGETRYNTDNASLEFYNGTAWKSVPGWEFVETQSVAAGSTLEFTGLDALPYRMLVFQIVSYTTASAGSSNLVSELRLSGGSYHTSGYLTGDNYITNGTGLTTNARTFALSTGVALGASCFISGLLYVFNIGDASIKTTALYDAFGYAGGGAATYRFVGSGSYDTAEINDALRFQSVLTGGTTPDNFTATVNLYGVR